MTRHLFLSLCLIVLAPAVFAQSNGTAEVRPAAPPTMFSYLATGMRVGIANIEGTASVRLSVYTEENETVAVATSKLPSFTLAATAAKTNLGIERELKAYMEQNDLKEASMARIRILGHSKSAFATIDAIGDDYLMISLDGDVIITPEFTQKRRRIIPKASVGSIDLDASPVRFITDPDRQPSKPNGEQ